MNKWIFIFLIFSFSNCKKETISDDFYFEKLQKEKNQKLLFSIGKNYFTKKCKACHRLNALGVSNLNGFNERFDYDFFSQFITNEYSLLKAKEDRTVQINEMFGNHFNHNYQYTEQEKKSIIFLYKSY